MTEGEAGEHEAMMGGVVARSGGLKRPGGTGGEGQQHGEAEDRRGRESAHGTLRRERDGNAPNMRLALRRSQRG